MNQVEYLQDKARELRKNIVTMIYEAQSGHPGGALSCADIVSVLYFNTLNIRPADPKWSQRDRVILSKGHVCPVIYAALAMKGYFDLNVLHSLRKMGSILQGHPDMKKVPGIDMTSGSLGQGLSVGAGMAFGAKVQNLGNQVYVILGDGEIQEGQVWEAAMMAAKYKLDNLIAIVDVNQLQCDGFTYDIMPTEPLKGKWESFGWKVFEIDGHDIRQIMDTFEKVKEIKDRPVCILARTVKGKGISYMENICEWHGKAPDEAQYKVALKDLGYEAGKGRTFNE